MLFKRIRELREDNDKSQRIIADILNIKQQQYYRYESGIISIPIEYLIMLADYYHTTIDYLVGRTDKK